MLLCTFYKFEMQASVLFNALNIFYADEFEEQDKKIGKEYLKGQKGYKTGRPSSKYENHLWYYVILN